MQNTGKLTENVNEISVEESEKINTEKCHRWTYKFKEVKNKEQVIRINISKKLGIDVLEMCKGITRES